jgi:hypothetical protein
LQVKVSAQHGCIIRLQVLLYDGHRFLQTPGGQLVIKWAILRPSRALNLTIHADHPVNSGQLAGEPILHSLRILTNILLKAA